MGMEGGFSVRVAVGFEALLLEALESTVVLFIHVVRSIVSEV